MNRIRPIDILIISILILMAITIGFIAFTVKKTNYITMQNLGFKRISVISIKNGGWDYE